MASLVQRRAGLLNFPFGAAPIHLVPSEPGVVSAPMAREDREARERHEADDADEAYKEDLHWQHP